MTILLLFHFFLNSRSHSLSLSLSPSHFSISCALIRSIHLVYATCLYAPFICGIIFSKKVPKIQHRKGFSYHNLVIVDLFDFGLLAIPFIYLFIFSLSPAFLESTTKPAINNFLRRNFYFSTPFYLSDSKCTYIANHLE